MCFICFVQGNYQKESISQRLSGLKVWNLSVMMSNAEFILSFLYLAKVSQSRGSHSKEKKQA